jgi:hypothetical protein
MLFLTAAIAAADFEPAAWQAVESLLQRLDRCRSAMTAVNGKTLIWTAAWR